MGPRAEFCFGRREQVLQVIPSAFDRNSLLLFGGRQSGKTTVLLKVAEHLNSNLTLSHETQMTDIGVYVDLMALPYDATPEHFYKLLANKALDVCTQHINGFTLRSLPSNVGEAGGGHESLILDILAIFEEISGISARILFLLDESQRVLGRRFPRAFQDNLFALLYGVDSLISERVAVVFSGNQELYRFCQDDTSPIGSRAAVSMMKCLDMFAVSEIEEALRACSKSKMSTSISVPVYELTGGHAGLTVRIMERALDRNCDSFDCSDPANNHLNSDHTELFRNWINSFTPEARCLLVYLSQLEETDLKSVAQYLKNKDLDFFAADRVLDEYVFTGVVSVSTTGASRTITKCTSSDNPDIWV